MKIILTLEVKRSTNPNKKTKKSSAPQKPTAPSNSSKTKITITQN